jgi:hypothetical protein
MPPLTRRTYLGVTISVKPEDWSLASIPFYCHVGPKQFFPHTENKSRVEFLTQERNRAMQRALALYPDTTHIVNIESNYLSQTGSIHRLIRTYDMIDAEVILGGSTWAKMEDRMPTYYQFYDGWATPELYYYRYVIRPPKGIVQVSSSGRA